MYDFDHSLFLKLNFDGGPAVDRLMLTLSGTMMWIPLYVLILWMVWRQEGIRRMVLFLVLAAGAVVLADIVAGIFKGNGLLGDLLPAFEPRWRPMFTPELEGLAITPDSLVRMREAAVPYDWAVHVPREALSGYYGTVSAHAATIAALMLLAAGILRRRWFTLLAILCTAVICYSRIYLAKHFPMDLLWGLLVGAAVGLAAVALYRHVGRRLPAPARR